MSERKFNLGGDKKKAIKGSRVERGTKQDLIKKRPIEREKLIPEIEQLLNDWDGGGLCIVYNKHDENENVTGAQIAVLGAEGIQGLIKLAKAVHSASESIIDDTVENMKGEGVEGMMALLAAAMDMHGDIFEKED